MVELQQELLDRRLRTVKPDELQAVQGEIKGLENVKRWFLRMPLPQQSSEKT
jgi:hypothetical protein